MSGLTGNNAAWRLQKSGATARQTVERSVPNKVVKREHFEAGRPRDLVSSLKNISLALSQTRSGAMSEQDGPTPSHTSPSPS